MVLVLTTTTAQMYATRAVTRQLLDIVVCEESQLTGNCNNVKRRLKMGADLRFNELLKESDDLVPSSSQTLENGINYLLSLLVHTLV